MRLLKSYYAKAHKYLLRWWGCVWLKFSLEKWEATWPPLGPSFVSCYTITLLLRCSIIHIQKVVACYLILSRQTDIRNVVENIYKHLFLKDKSTYMPRYQTENWQSSYQWFTSFCFFCVWQSNDRSWSLSFRGFPFGFCRSVWFWQSYIKIHQTKD